MARLVILILVLTPILSGCGDDETADSPDILPIEVPDGGEGDSTVDQASPADTVSDDMNGADDTPDVSGTCTMLFGNPSELTGLSAAQCQPSCACGGVSFSPPAYDEAFIAGLEAWTLLNPPAELESNPYEDAPPMRGDEVCAMVPEDVAARTYRLENFSDEAAALAANARLTHHGPCGLCSSLQDLATYLRYPDLTEPVRECSLLAFSEDESAVLTCIQALGFTAPCAQIWFYNALNTRDRCLGECITRLEDPYHLPDGSPNPCIQCDEDISGPVFKAFAARTRRNSGLASALCRPCDTVKPVIHSYP